MHDHQPPGDAQRGPQGRLRAVSRYVFLGFVAIAAFFLITEHRAHLFGILPFLLLAACPLLHFFHHRGHGHGGEAGPAARAPPASPPPGSGSDDHRH